MIPSLDERIQSGTRGLEIAGAIRPDFIVALVLPESVRRRLNDYDPCGRNNRLFDLIGRLGRAIDTMP